MSKFKIRFKLQGLEVDVEGSREDLPHLTQAIGNQLASALSPALDMAGGSAAEPEMKDITPERLSAVPAARKVRKRRTSAGASGSSDSAAGVEIDWVHDPAKWGTPSQSWNTADKCVWLLYVADKERGLTELTQAQLTATFNKHFKQSGLIKPFNVSRDLGKRKTGKEALVGENTTRNPSCWFLTENGNKYAVNLVAQQLGTAPIPK